MENNKLYDVNIEAQALINKYESEKVAPQKKTKFDTKNYLQARLGENENSKSLTIRLLPFSPEGGYVFQEVHMHTVKVNKDVSSSGWKTFVCPTHNKNEKGELFGDKCPFCEISAKAKELKMKSLDDVTKKQYGEIEFLNHERKMWVVRCIERGHEEDGVKFWLFNSSTKGDGPYDKIYNLAKQRLGEDKFDILDLNNGKDLVLTLTRGEKGKTSIQIIDKSLPTPLSEDVEEGKKWLNDPKKWSDVYTVKPYDYMSIIADKGVPYYDKSKGKYVSKEEYDKSVEETKAATQAEAEKNTEGISKYEQIASGVASDDLDF